jgi:hypothetical protein
MFTHRFKSLFVFLLFFAFVGQVTASKTMSCEMSKTTVQKSAMSDVNTEHDMHFSETTASNMSHSDMNHDCCDDDANSSGDHCGGNCQCLFGGCSFVYLAPVNVDNDAVMPITHVSSKLTSSPRQEFLSFLFRPPII